MIFSLDSFLRILRFLPLIESVLNRRFWYVICVNTLVWSIGFWLLTGGGSMKQILSVITQSKISSLILCYGIAFFMLFNLFPLVLF